MPRLRHLRTTISCLRLQVECSRSGAGGRAVSSRCSRRGLRRARRRPGRAGGRAVPAARRSRTRRRVGRRRRGPRASSRESARRGHRKLASLAPLLVVDEFAPDRSTPPRRTGTRGSTACSRAAGAEPHGPPDLDAWRDAPSRTAPARRAARGTPRALRRARARVGAVPRTLARRPEQRGARAARSIDAGRDAGDRLPLGGRQARAPLITSTTCSAASSR